MSQPFLHLDTSAWIPIRDGDHDARKLYERHYSARRNRGDAKKILGPGEYLMLMTPDVKALLAWRKFRSMDTAQIGVNCAIFRNEGSIYGQSSYLLSLGMQIAWDRWPGERLYTYVDSRRVRSANPGYCFLMAGWRRCGQSKGGLLILEAQGTAEKENAQ